MREQKKQEEIIAAHASQRSPESPGEALPQRSHDETRRFVPMDEALKRIGDGEYVHCFTTPSAGMLVGSDWERANVIDAFQNHGVEEAGPAATAMGHTLAVRMNGRAYFFKAEGR